MRFCYANDFTKMVTWSDIFQKMNKESQKNLLEYGLHMMRESLVADAGVDDIIRLEGEELNFVKKFGQVMDIEKISKIIDLLNQGIFHLERNASARILFLDTSLNLARILKQ